MSTTANTYPCPCCGFLVFSEPAGSYAICPLCGWEDDHVQLGHPGMRGGANGGSLKEYQDSALRDLPPSVEEYQGYVRHPDWRPLRDDECVAPSEPSGGGVAYFRGALADTPPYYWELDRKKR